MIIHKIILVIVTNFVIYNAEAARSTSFPIGGLFNRLALQTSISAFENKVGKVSGTRAYHGRSLVSKVVDSYSTSLEICDFTSDDKGIVALIDARPTNGICDNTCLLANRLNILHLSLGWQPTETLADDLFTFAYHPPPELISKGFAALIKELQWDKFSVLYEDEGSFIRLQEVINSWPTTSDPIMFRKLNPEEDNKEIFKEIFKVSHMSYHILDCHIDSVYKYMNEIVQVENSTEFQSFILTNLDAYLLNFQDIPTLLANVSTLHLTTSNDAKWKDMGVDSDMGIQLETALTADALDHVERAISTMQKNINEYNIKHNISKAWKFKEPPALCFLSSKAEYEEIVWPLGIKLMEALNTTVTSGFTGDIAFEKGKRTNFTLYYSKLTTESKFINVGIWDSKTNLIIKVNDTEDRSTAVKTNSKIRVATKLVQPYYDEVLYDNGTTIRKGYAVDLVEEIFKHIKVTHNIELQHEFYVASGDKVGSRIPGSKKWDGIIGDVMDHKAGLGICDLTITAERNSAVDFSVPFMSLGISMLFREPDPENPDMFSFVNPLSLDVWLYLATTYILVSFVLLICARMSQDDWVNPHACNQNPEHLENIWSLYNCMWLTMGAIMTQGCDILPRAPGSRWITGMWWFFAMIVTASYTANMSTFLSNSRRSSDIKNVQELSEQNKISYGALFNGSTYNFFQSSNDSIYQKIFSTMESAKPSAYTNTNEEGVNRVLRSKGKYVFFMESTAIEYFTERNNSLKMVGPHLDSKDYGIAMPKNYVYKGWIDNAILSLQQSGVLDTLKNKWWKVNEKPPNSKEEENEEDDDGSLQMKNTSGIFLVLGTGGLLGLVVAIIDFLLHAEQISVKEKVSFWEALVSECRASLDPRMLHKPVAPPRSAPPSTATPSPRRERSQSRAVSVLRAASSFINFDEIY
ncbi:hypothetical protein K1T71_001256 [Dendrolimus kikuchii]|uniref:Uncharacterized protein n=1 Tax=Dendrolimus kikuchii TaxID=765133 RepID=A0ACC1DHJ6_9NEOP|nr:hypothetical protein K1T71_001256 [Dendrolimus kikuchii]